MADLVWDERLLTPARALALAGHWNLRLVQRTELGTPLRPVAVCSECRRPVVELGWRFCVEGVLAAVLRHAVVHHGLVLSGMEGIDDRREPARGPGGPPDAGGGAGGREPGADPPRCLDEAPASRGAEERP